MPNTDDPSSDDGDGFGRGGGHRMEPDVEPNVVAPHERLDYNCVAHHFPS